MGEHFVFWNASQTAEEKLHWVSCPLIILWKSVQVFAKPNNSNEEWIHGGPSNAIQVFTKPDNWNEEWIHSSPSIARRDC
jgi:hypothetical protein